MKCTKLRLKDRKGILALVTVSLMGLSSLGLASTPTCVSDVSDTDGDGWGWESNQSCVVALVPNGGSWPGCSSADSDADGDGYGWENSQTCVVTGLTDESTNRQHPVCQSTDSDSDNDGWGWENSESCIVEGDVPDAGAALPGIEYPTCIDSDSDPDNDGWGWENEESCTVTANNDSDDSDEDPQIDPVTDAGDPVCLSTASDSDGTGYGFEFNRSCKVVDGVSKTADDPLFDRELCDSWAEIAYGDYRIQNNTWNSSAVYSDRWSQCIELQQNSAGEPVAVWHFDWLDRFEGNQDAVKSYPQVYYGRKNERNLTGTPEEVGLPRPIDELDRYRVDYAFSAIGDAEYNVALESFFHTSCEADNDNKQFEMMVWVGVPGEKTPGVQVTTATIDGTLWNIYANPVLSHGYVAFVPEQTITSGQLDWNSFIDWSRENGSSLGLGDLENTCMGAIEMGTETFWGELDFRLERFDVVRN